jgi:hypothetical protein
VLSLIVPIRNEPPESAARFARFAGRGDVELVVADGGGSADAAARFAALGARVVAAEGSRGRALGRAAEASGGEILLFFHADATPPENAPEAAAEALSAGAVAGAFALAYEDATPALRWIAWWANLRARALGLAFGDQGLFCRRTDYARAGGFRDLPIAEDLDLVRRLARLGRFVIRPERTNASPRRFRDAGTLRQVLRDWRVEAGWFAGVPPETLARWYRGGDAPGGRATSPPRRE